MRSVTWVTFYAGVLIGASYLAGSVVRTWAARRMGADDEARPDPLAVVSEVIVTVACAWIAYTFIDWLAPGGTVFRSSSAVGFLSPKTLTVWESIALWSGLGAILGSIAPITSRFTSGSMGISGAAGLLAVYSPIIFLIALGTWFIGIGLLRSVRLTLPAVFVTVAISEWILSMTRVRVAWGLIHGPESTIWMAVLAGVLLARWTHGGPSAHLGEPPRN
jgi:glycerol-3-phosphate acyltransferase PlsY